MAHLVAVVERFDTDQGMARACEATKDFVFPEEVYKRDQSIMDATGSLTAVIEEVQSKGLADRFNADRVKACIPESYPEYSLLLDIATHGAPIDLPEDFIPSGQPEEPRVILRQMPLVMQMHAHKAWSKNRGVLIRWSTLPDAEKAQVHFNPCHWNMEKVVGRWLIDCSNRAEGFNLNTPETKAASQARLGQVRDETIQDIFASWYAYSETESVPFSECYIWKADIEGAFPQFRWQPWVAKLMGMMITEDMLYLHTSGNFGHTSSPGVWWVVSNALKFFCLLMGILGVLSKYVDDFHGFGKLAHALRDEAVFAKCARAYFGDSALNDDKTVHPTQQTDVLGWECKVVEELSFPNQKGCDKILLVFFCFVISKAQTRELWEVLAGVAERYAIGLVGMRAFVAPFHHMKEKCGAKTTRNARLRSGSAIADSSARFCIEMWRAEALLLWHDPMLVAVPMRSMAGPRAARRPVFRTESDAGPEGIGAVVYGEDARCDACIHKLPITVGQRFEE